MTIFKKKIIRHDKDLVFIKISHEAQQKYPGDYLNQIKYVKENGSEQHYCIFMIQCAQHVFSLPSTGKVEFDRVTMDYMLRGFLDATRHMQSKLPGSIYGYINKNIEGFIKSSVNQAELKFSEAE